MPTDDDQERERDLRVRIADEIEAIMRREGIGGVVMLVSKTHAAWRLVLPEWVAMVPDPKRQRWILQIRGSTPAGHERTELTFHFMGTLRDMARDVVELFGRMFRMGKAQLELSGGSVEHEPFAGGQRIDPEGGKSS